ncbi:MULTISPECIES: acyl-CoA dehydrogenase C-terminal domain-containing protein [Rhodobacterales]|jgi:alkylation response protein AidB-like acyl-CoA dehydrogenase|uniref:acyl-CoA dehydrogenase C-terminal domain-containing protein n=1 Tax=Rhodobacterales TaxID=204455 RepID=UPI00237FBAB9|nr:acyl-CoA dehydrogenase C-terminal domain-containing protein [Phaeobacter gallaeciensis]MDE4139106.1 acyl-CoA dehydrogenase C-terminal domain-containing protein [Phaeobacter gallaeciensis]MDE4147836.1 acyl-CoA dehydrogenase C-terminal domain-containing protein [Phaeobacter gallaeciensis]MDE4152054.1 acyl-CoA dehydrogenase C-terminal domain-containing protein [Phaeobacter gallaeciensis]MDE4227162.1 acyl-CoA dehydrogenase C-terminal domain-containing protein [Phaeobacter gallaeciensis]MDE42565
MPVYNAPTKDTQFILHDVLKVSEAATPGYSELERDFTGAILEEAGKISSEVLHPLNVVGDTEGCRLENGIVYTPTGFKDAFEQVKEGGWTGLDMPEQYGGQNMPYVLGTAVGELFSSANQAFVMYQGLTHGAASAILAHGTDAQKDTYLPKMVSCEWTGTMNLTEPHCGTDLGLMRTKAEPQADGTYKVSGQKIFISAGDHDMSENVIHLVLAKIPGGPEGIKGVSLFIVPKFIVNEDGSVGERNGVSVGNIEKKMGIHGNSTCVMNYDEATGYLLGTEHKGMRAMFTMMNEARLGVGMQGVAQAEAAYQNAVEYAKDRLQGRDVTGVKNPDGPADPLIVHPDIRRSLMDQKSFVEGGRAFLLWGATMIDKAHRDGDKDADGLVSLLTPVIKGFLTDEGYDMTVKAQQVYGGHGYIEEHGMSQYTRDARIAQIYEGANGVQALDLVGRKLAQDGGKHVMAFFDLVKNFCKENAGISEDYAKDFIEPLKAASKDLQAAGMYFMQNGMKNPNNALSGSYDFMHMFGHVCLGLMWAQMAKAAHAALEAGTSDAAFYETKLTTGRYYMARRLPATQLHLVRIQSGADTVMALDAASF